MNDFELVHFKPGEQLFSAGDQADKLYVIQQGELTRVLDTDGDGRADRFETVSDAWSWGGEHEYLRGEQQLGSEYNWKCRECDYEELDEPPYCEDCDFDMCPSCGYGEPNDEDRATCATHKEKVEA